MRQGPAGALHRGGGARRRRSGRGHRLGGRPVLRRASDPPSGPWGGRARDALPRGAGPRSRRRTGTQVRVRARAPLHGRIRARRCVGTRAEAGADRAAGPSAQAAAARAQRTKVLARRRRTTVMLFLAFTLGAIVAAVGGLAFLWAPAAPAVLLSAYIAYLRSQERRRFAYQMDRRSAEAAAQRLRERERQPRRRAPLDAPVADEPEEVPATDPDTGLSALAADRRALVEQTDHAEWVDQQRERERRPGQGDSWDPVPVPLPTYVTAPVAPRASSDVDLGAPDTWSAARSGPVLPEQETGRAQEAVVADGTAPAAAGKPVDGRSDARRAASARRSRERGHTPLFDQYEDGDRPLAANE
ncbi:divisome protein SepX/GlpR [Streptomyces albidocamelliae]